MCVDDKIQEAEQCVYYDEDDDDAWIYQKNSHCTRNWEIRIIARAKVRVWDRSFKVKHI